MNTDVCYNMDEPQKSTELKKSDAKNNILFDSLSVKCPGMANF